MQDYIKKQMPIKNNDLIQTSGELFEAVQLAPCFSDSKTFVDMTPKRDSQEILKDFKALKNQNNFNLKDFILENFDLPKAEEYSDIENGLSLHEHIIQMWDFLTKSADEENPQSSLLELPNSYVIPGGRFREIYYWDCYFTAEGLAAYNKLDMVENIADNFKYLVEQFGFIPNGNRTYYLTRSQPPLFFLIVDILYKHYGISRISKYLPVLEKEYSFWMNTNRNIGGLNRYWDEASEPRPESYREDIHSAKDASNRADFYRNIRAACESGWDFSSRWFHDVNKFETICTTDILPIDLNCYLFGLEERLSTWFKDSSDLEKSSKYRDLANKRKSKIQKDFWSEEQNFFCDINHKEKSHTNALSLAGATPLFFNIATKEQASKLVNTLSKFVFEGGLSTTLVDTSQQWDYPNGWAPLHWQVIIGLRNYGYSDIAKDIADRFLNTIKLKYKETGKLKEKYNVSNAHIDASGGEYIIQDGFGWTNGVVSALLKLYN
ncbi:trehalase family glycosidase [Francisella frigiditurris]|nr:trehalase family glycosidase [Francisella frigiditurris]